MDGFELFYFGYQHLNNSKRMKRFLPTLKFNYLFLAILAFVLLIQTNVGFSQTCGFNNNTNSNIVFTPCINLNSHRQTVSSNIDSHQYFVLNVIKGLDYEIYTCEDPSNKLKLVIYDEVSGTFLASSNSNSGNPCSNHDRDVYLSWTATFSGQVRVLINQDSSCSSLTPDNITLMVDVTGGSNTQDDESVAAANSWIGHIYDATDFTHYLGYYSKAETFNETFGGAGNDIDCFSPVNSNSTVRANLLTVSFSVRYRMTSSKRGLWIVNIGSDDGSRLSVDGTLVYTDWGTHAYTDHQRILMDLTGTSSLVLDYYENTGGNQVSFQTFTQVLANNLSSNTTQSLCIGNSGSAIGGDTYGALLVGITLSGTGYQWAYSATSATGPWTNIAGATAATYTPSSAAAPFNVAGTYYIIRRAVLSSANNVSPKPYVAINESNTATLTIAPLLGTPTAITISAGTEPTCQLPNGTTTTTYATTATNNTGFNWSLSNGAAGSIAATTGLMTWANGFSGSVDIRVTANGCNGPSSQVTKTVSITSNNSISLTSAIGTNSQNICITSAIKNITYSTTISTGATFNGLPLGVSGNWTANTVTISGTPTEVASSNYIVTLTGGCGNTTTSGTIIVNAQPTATASGTLAICDNTSGTVSGATASNGSILWTHNGAGSLTNATTLTPTYTANNADGGKDITLTMTVSNSPCPAATAFFTMAVENAEGVAIDMGDNMDPICYLGGVSAPLGVTVSGSNPILQWSSDKGGTFSNDADPNATWTSPGTTAIGTVTLTLSAKNGCSVNSATKTIVVQGIPTVGMGGPMQDICEGVESAPLAGSVGAGATGGIWSTLAGGTFNPGPTDLNATWTPPNGFIGTAVLKLTTTGSKCSSSWDEKPIIVYQIPTIDDQPIDQLDCYLNAVKFSVIASGSNLTYEWQRRKPSDPDFITIPVEADITYPLPSGTIQIARAGTSDAPDGTLYRVHIYNLADPVCSVLSSPVTLTVNKITAVIPAAVNVTECYGSNYTLTASTNYPANVLSYSWERSIINGIWTSVTDGGVISNSTTNHLTITGGTPTESAEYRVFIKCKSSGADCELSSDDFTRKITFLPQLNAPVINAVPAICYNFTPALLTATAAMGGSGTTYSYQWQNSPDDATWTNVGGNSLTYQPGALTSSTYYRIIATDSGVYACGQTVPSGSIQVVVNPLPTISTTGTMDAVCFGSSAQTTTLAYSTAENNPISYSINWTTLGIVDQVTTAFDFATSGGSLNSISIPANTAAGTYNGTMTITNINGCSGTQAVSVTINGLPTIATDGTMIAVCFSEGIQTTTLAYTATTYSPVSYSIVWTTGGIADQPSTAFAFGAGAGSISGIMIPANTVAGNYNGIMTITNGFGCINTKAVSVKVNAWPTITTTGALANVSYNTNAQTTTLVYIATGNQATSYNIDWNEPGLTDQVSTAFAFAPGGGSLTGITIPAGTAAGNYTGTMILRNADGCINTQMVSVTVYPLPTITTSGMMANVCFSNSAQTTILAYSATENNPISYSIDWTTAGIADQGNTAFVFAAGGGTLSDITLPANTAAGTYIGTMSIINGNGSSNTQAVSVTINGLPTIATDGTIVAVCFNEGIQTTTLAYTATTYSPVSYSIDWTTGGIADQPLTAFAFGPGAGSISGITIPANTAAGNYNGIVSITNGLGCINTKAVSVTVNAWPTIATTGAMANLCFNTNAQTTTLVYTATVNLPTTYSIDWNESGLTDQVSTAFAFTSGGGTLTGIKIPAGTAAGNYTGTMILRNADGCINTQMVSVTVYPLPTITTSGTMANVCFSSSAQTTTLAYSATENNPISYSIDWTTAGIADQGTTAFVFATSGSILSGISIPANTAAGIYNGSMTITNGNGCTNIQVISVTINPIPTVNAIADQSICNGSATTPISFTGAVPGTVYSWENDNADIGLEMSGTGNIASFIATNSTTANAVANITVTPTYTHGGITCEGSPITFVVTVYPTPNVFASLPVQNKCSGLAMSTVSFSSSISGTTYHWTRDHVADVTGKNASGNGPISGTLTNTTTTAITVTFTVTPKANGCSGIPIEVTVIVNPSLTLSSATTDKICSGSAFSYTPLSGAAGVSFTWSRAGILGISNIAATNKPGSITETLVNTTGSSIDVEYVYTLSLDGCTNTTAQVLTVTVFPQPYLNRSATEITCSGEPFEYKIITTTDNAATTKNWTRAYVDGISALSGLNAGTGDINETLTNSKNFPIDVIYTYILKYGTCSTSVPVTITVNPTPTVNSLSNLEYCVGESVPARVLTGPVAGTIFEWFNSNPAIGLADRGTGPVPMFSATNMTSSVITANISVRPTANSCIGANTSLFTITVWPASVGGSVSGTTSVCSGSNGPTTMNLTGKTGTINKWQYSTNAGGSWTDIVNVTTSQVYQNLVTTTWYRAEVKSGTCNAEFSNPAIINVTSGSVGGTISGATIVCSGSNTGNVSLSGYTGTIQGWEYSTNGGASYLPVAVANTSNSQSYSGLTATTLYRAVVQNGTCAVAYATPASISIDPVSNGGSVIGSTTVCTDTNNTLLSLISSVGNVVRWESSVDNFVTPVTIPGTAGLVNYTAINLSSTTQFRAVVKSGVCGDVASSTVATITVTPKSVGGIVAGSTTVCEGINTSVITLSGHTGSVLRWESSTDNWITLVPIANNSASLTAVDLNILTKYRAVIQNGVCPSDYSSDATITVNPKPIATAGGSVTICSNGTATVSGASALNGTIAWTENGNGSITSGATGLTPVYTPTATDAGTTVTLTMTVTSNNVCTPQTATAFFTVIVQPLPTAAGVGTQTICANSTATVSGFSSSNGTIAWSENGAGSITSGTNTLTPTYTPAVADGGNTVTLTMTVTSNNACAPQTATVSYSVIVNAASNGGSISPVATTLCSGTNSTLLTISGQTGNILRWESSTNNWGAITDISNTLNTYTVSNLATTTKYRAVLQSGICGSVYSSEATITVSPTPTLIVSNLQIICSGTMSLATAIGAGTTAGLTITYWTDAVATSSAYATPTIASAGTYYIKGTVPASGCYVIQPVVVTLYTTIGMPVFAAGATSTYCNGAGGTVSYAAIAANAITYIYSIDAASDVLNDINATTGALTIATGYTGPITISVSATGCGTKTATHIVTVKKAPIVTATANPTSVCAGGATQLTSSVSNFVYSNPLILSENFNGTTNTWTTVNSSTGGTLANAAWTLRPIDYIYGGDTYNSNDKSQFYFTNSAAQGNGGTTSTTLRSPAFSTMGYNSVTLDFWQYYNDDSNADAAYVEASTDNSTWVNLPPSPYTTDQGNRNPFNQHPSIPLTAAYINKPVVYIRFRYVASDDRYWGIDNVSINGVPTTVPTISWTSSPTGFVSALANPTANPLVATTYTAIYTDPTTHCTGSSSVSVAINPAPTPVITPDYCSERPFVWLSAPSGYAYYKWSTGEEGAMMNRIKVDLAGYYTVTVTDAFGCTGTSPQLQVADEKVVNGNFWAGNTGFTTPLSGTNQYTYKADVAGTGELGPEGTYGVGPDGQNYHTDFWGPGRGGIGDNYMIINGFPGSPQPIVWRQTINSLTIGTVYYFAAFARSLNSAGQTNEQANLKFSINGTQLGQSTGTLPYTTPGGPYTWFKFYGNWTADATSAVLEIVDLTTAVNANDFGLDDISFGTMASVGFGVVAVSNSDGVSTSTTICTGTTLQLDATTTGGRPTVTYSWSGPNGFTSTLKNPTINNVTAVDAGVYTVKSYDFYHCEPPNSSSTTVVFNQKPMSEAQTVDMCSGSTNSFVLVTGTPTAATIVADNTTYSWGAPSNPGGVTGVVTSGSGAGNIPLNLVNISLSMQTVIYTVIPATASCAGAPFTLTVNVYPAATITGVVNKVQCADVTNVTLQGTISGAATSATWSGGTTTSFNPNRTTVNAVYTPTAAEITAGIINLTLTTNDPAGPCSAAIASMTITMGALPVLSSTKTDVNCYGNSTGAIDLTITGTPSYVWTASNGGLVPSGQSNIQDLTTLRAGTYTVIATGINGCTATTSVTITQPAAALAATVVATGTLCSGNATGTVTTAVSGGTPGYSYTWSASGGGTIPVGQTNIPNLTNLIAGTYTVAISDSKGCAISPNISRTVVGQANTAPNITQCPSPITISPGCNTSGILALTGLVYSETIVVITPLQWTSAGGVAIDNCSIATYKYQDSKSGTCPMVVTRTFTLTDGDAAPLTTTCSQTITIEDLVAPTWTTSVNALNVFISCSDVAAYNIAQSAAPTATDNCGGAVVLNKTSGSFVASALCGQSGTYTNTWTATDACGKISSTYTQVITKFDNTAPVWDNILVGSLNISIECDDITGLNDAQSMAPNTTDATDNCDATLTLIKTSGVINRTGFCGQGGKIINSWVAIDDCGNTSAAFNQTITINDTKAPTWIDNAGGLDQAISCSNIGELNAAKTMIPKAIDNCDADDKIVITKIIDNFYTGGTCPQIGTYTNQWTATDVCGNVSLPYTQIIHVSDNTAPVLSCPPNKALAYGDSSLPANTGTATATDNCAAQADISITYADVATVVDVCNFSIARTWTATDQCGNFSLCTQTITSQDIGVPVVTGSIPLQTVAGCTMADLPTALTTVAALQTAFGLVITDDNALNPLVTSTDQQLSGPCPIVVKRTYVVEDFCGNAISIVQTINVQDITPPSVVGSIPVSTIDGCSAAAAPVAATSIAQLEILLTSGGSIIDNCLAKASLLVSHTDAVNGTCPITITRTYNIKDNCNTTILVQTIKIQDVTNPKLTGGNANPITTIQGCNVSFAPTVLTTITQLETLTGGTLGDNCTARLTLTIGMTEATLPGCTIVITRTYMVKDACSNAVVITHTIKIQDTTAPIVTGTITATDVEGCAVGSAPVAVNTVAALEALAGGITINDACTAKASLAVTSSQTFTGTCPIVITRTYIVKDACGNSVTITHKINIKDTTAPVLIADPPSKSFCVERIYVATYNGLPEPGADMKEDRPDYYTLQLDDLDLNSNTFSDICTPKESLILHWSITDAANQPVKDINNLPLTDATGQVSAHIATASITLLGAPSVPIKYTINYWLVDLCNNSSAKKPAIIIITPRPDITKMTN